MSAMFAPPPTTFVTARSEATRQSRGFDSEATAISWIAVLRSQ